MNKKLTAKVQQLFPQDLEGAEVFSGCFVIEPQEKEVTLKKGSIYGVFDLQHQGKLSLELTNNIINDVLNDAYYQSDNISPIQSLEKAIAELNEKLIKIPNETTIAADIQKTTLNLIAVVLCYNWLL